MENNIYVGNLPYSINESGLEEEFASCGEVEQVNLITDRETGRSKGFGFITFTTPEAVTAAIEKNGIELDGRKIRVSQAQERAPRRTERR